MLSTRLIRMIEGDAQKITKQLLEEVHQDKLLPRFRQLSDSSLLRRFENVCANVGRWLQESDEATLAKHYEDLGRERFDEGIPLHEVVHAAHIFKRRLTDYARNHCYEQTAYEAYAEEELERLLNSFFDRVVFYIVRGYEVALSEAAAAGRSSLSGSERSATR